MSKPRRMPLDKEPIFEKLSRAQTKYVKMLHFSGHVSICNYWNLQIWKKMGVFCQSSGLLALICVYYETHRLLAFSYVNYCITSFTLLASCIKSIILNIRKGKKTENHNHAYSFTIKLWAVYLLFNFELFWPNVTVHKHQISHENP